MLPLRSPGLILLLILAAAIASLAGSPGPALADDRRSITVTGEGSAFAVPDMAMLSAGVVSEGATAGEALAANSKTTGSVIERFRAGGIDGKDIQTAGFSLQPVYVYPKPEDGNAVPPRITGYSVSNTVSVRVRDIARIGAVMDMVVAAGANTLGSIDFIVSHQSEILDRARQDAVSDARRKAGLYAAAAGARLGSVLTLSEQSAIPGEPRPMYRMQAAEAAPVPVAAGQTELKVGVTVTFGIED